MNERIKELAIEAGMIVGEANGFDMTRLKTREVKFAELIVKECTTVINEIPRYAKTTNLKGYENACIADSIRAIKEHFGVKE